MSRSVVAQLRDLMPIRPLRYAEALRKAESQAQQFLKLSDIGEPLVPERIITDLPRIRVSRLSPFPTSGATHWTPGLWLVGINGAEPATRQRFSLAHEFKHIVDHVFVDVIYGSFPEQERAAMVKRICDYFAGCLLMPRAWVKRYYCSGIQYLPDLAGRFGVSQMAMSVRLQQIGLTEPTPRCLPSSKDWTLQAVTELTGRPLYERSAALVT